MPSHVVGTRNYNTLLCLVWNGTKWANVEARNVIKILYDTFKDLKLHLQAIYHDIVVAHLLRAGGAMYLKLNGYDDTTIMKMGQWTSLTFLQYINNQISHLSKAISEKNEYISTICKCSCYLRIYHMKHML